MAKIDVKLDENLVSRVQAAQVEFNGLQNMLGFCLATTQYDIPAEKVEKVRRDYIEKSKEYDLVREEVTNLIKKDHPEAINWELNFESGIAVVDLGE